MQENNFLKIKIIFIYLNKREEFFSDFFFINTENHDYSIFLDHKDLILSLKNSNLKFFINEKIKDEKKNINGIFFLKNNTASFIVN